MICILAGNYREAERWASAQLLDRGEWFYPTEPNELKRKSNFHVLVIGTAGENVPSSYFEKIFSLAKERGRIGRS